MGLLRLGRLCLRCVPTQTSLSLKKKFIQPASALNSDSETE